MRLISINSFTAKLVLERFSRGEIFVNIILKLLVSNGKIAAKQQNRPLEIERTLILLSDPPPF